MKRLQNKVAIVTGAAGGMGATEAKLFAEEGAKVMATDMQEDKLRTWVEKAKVDGLEIEYSFHDVASKASWDRIVAKTLELFGHIDILINNAGIYPAGENLENTTEAMWNKVLAINLTGPFLGTQMVVPYMKKAGKGSIVNIDSIAGLVGGNGPAYTASKGGLRLLTKDNAVELAKFNIRVNSIHPGGVLTPMTESILTTPDSDQLIKNICPMERIGQPLEIAYGALYLASDEASYVTGAELTIDGGLVAR
ncbi:MAG: SDR family NAD(P)-dependent oxidoreductase [Flavipsychrobacter sp.]